MRLMGIDYGSKRVGVAISDPEAAFAIPFEVLDNSKKLTDRVVEIARKNNVIEVILGESKNYKGENNAIMESSLQFKKKLEEEGLKVYFEPEFMTSVAAERFQGKNSMLDASAAALILQSYLDKNKKT